MAVHDANKQYEAVYGWWNSDSIKKWDYQYTDYDIHSMEYLNSRQHVVLEFLNRLNLPQGAKVLELGYGAGQTVSRIGQMGFETHGVDISEKLHAISDKRCQEECPEGTFYLTTGNIEKLKYEDNSFDAVILVGALQYLYDPHSCLNEVYRVLKPGAHFIIGQRSAYSLGNFGSLRDFCRSLVHFFLIEPYELFPSFKSILCDSRLGKFFSKYEKAKWMNTKFMLKGHDEYKYKLKKHLISCGRLKRWMKKAHLKTLKGAGAYFAVSETGKHNKFNLKADKFLRPVIQTPIFHFLYPLGRTFILLAQKPLKNVSSQKA